MDLFQIVAIVVVLIGLFLLWGRHEAQKSGRLDAYKAMKAERRDAVVRDIDGDEVVEPEPAPDALPRSAAPVQQTEPAPEEDWVGARLVGSEIQVRGSTPAEIKIAIRELRLMKKDEQVAKRELAAVKAEQRATWRERQAGRIGTTGMGRGTFGKIARASIQAGRRSERMGHADKINAIQRQQAVHDRNVLAIDRLIAQCEAALVRADKG